MSKIHLAITIDVEPDCSPNWDRSNPISFKSVTHGIPNLLAPIFNQFNAKPTYLLSPEVLEDNESIESILSLNGKYELGTHLHPEFIEPEKEYSKYDGAKALKFACYDYSDEIEFEKLRNLTDSFEQKIGYKPLCYRAGRFGADISTIQSLAKLGYLVDSSVTPHINWAKQNGPDFKNYPEQPFFIDQDNFAKENKDSNILEVPVSIGGKRLPLLPDNWLFYKWLRPTHMTVWEQKRLIKQYAQKYKDKQHIVFCMMFHSMEIIPHASPYARSQNSVNRILHRMTAILKIFKEMNADFFGLTDIYNLYKPDP